MCRSLVDLRASTMELLNLLLALISLLCPLIPETRAQFPNGACTIEGSTCEITDDNLVGIVSDVSNVAECRQGTDSLKDYSLTPRLEMACDSILILFMWAILNVLDLKPKCKQFFKLKLKLKTISLNWLPAVRDQRDVLCVLHLLWSLELSLHGRLCLLRFLLGSRRMRGLLHGVARLLRLLRGVRGGGPRRQHNQRPGRKFNRSLLDFLVWFRQFFVLAVKTFQQFNHLSLLIIHLGTLFLANFGQFLSLLNSRPSGRHKRRQVVFRELRLRRTLPLLHLPPRKLDPLSLYMLPPQRDQGAHKGLQRRHLRQRHAEL